MMPRAIGVCKISIAKNAYYYRIVTINMSRPVCERKERYIANQCRDHAENIEGPERKRGEGGGGTEFTCLCRVDKMKLVSGGFSIFDRGSSILS